MRYLYSLLLYALTPYFLLRLVWRGWRAPDYWQRWHERFGLIDPLPVDNTLWIHAVSVGEVQAAIPLIHRLRAHYPELPILITTMTPTGSRHVRKHFGADVFHRYVPYDLPDAVWRFLRATRPKIALVMETELWPNLFHFCKRRHIPVIVANARMSEKSAHGYTRVAALTRQTLANVTAIAAQHQPDADRLIKLGADAARVSVTGSIKFDISISDEVIQQGAALRDTIGRERPVWIAASTHEGEEEMVLAAFTQVRRSVPNALLMLVPRHPERFAQVAGLCNGKGFTLSRRSQGSTNLADADVYLGDSMGELMSLYAAADVAFVGGSLMPVGGHNMLEPAALGLPVLTGPHVHTFQEITTQLVGDGAARLVDNSEHLASEVEALLMDEHLRHTMGAQGKQVVADNRGALDQLMEVISQHMGK